MNLNYGYDKQTMTALAETADKTLDEHNVVIDYDGEVIIDPEMYFPTVALSSYKFATRIKDGSLRHEVMRAALYDALEMIHEMQCREADLYIVGNKGPLKIAA
jgi:hypothetical protein